MYDVLKCTLWNCITGAEMAVTKRNKKRKLEEEVAMEEVESSSDSSSEEQEQEEEEEKADSSESEEESVEAAQQDSEESEEENVSAEESKQEVDSSSDSSESEEESAAVEEIQQDSSDNSESEEESTPAVQNKQVDSSSSDTSDSEEETAAVEEMQQDDSDSSESEEESVPPVQEESSDDSESEEEQEKPRAPIKVEMSSLEPKKKKAKTEKEEVEEEFGDDEIRLRSVRRLLEAIPRNELTKILADATTQYDELYCNLKTAAESRVAYRKVFVRDLAAETGTKTLKASFKSFGKIEDGAVIYDKSGKSRGFGFIIFTEVEAAVRVVARKSIIINGHKVSCNYEFIKHDAPYRKAPGGPAPQKSQQEKQALHAEIYKKTKGRKLFVLGLRQHTREQTLREQFKEFGELEDIKVVLDRATKKSKGYAFITFSEKAGANAALKNPPKKIDGRTISCSLATLSNKNNKKHGGKAASH